jgi:organic hydroperoxide reductase OsmC/OhrA
MSCPALFEHVVQFAEVAKEAEGRCPVSNAYRGTMQITVDAKVG